MEKTKLKVSVIGCGWLGLPLCKRLQSLGYEIITTSSHQDKINLLSDQFTILEFDLIKQNPDEQLLNSDFVIYTIPPRELDLVEAFFRKLKADQKTIFISSTSVYGKMQGDCTEDTPKFPESKNGKLLLETETSLKKLVKNLTIIRPGGLYGEKRHPINFLQGKTDLDNGQELTHLVHLDDCINAIIKIMTLNLWGNEFNLVNDIRIKKEKYYPETANLRGLIAPQYKKITNEIKNQTNISNEKSKRLLSMKYMN